MPDQDDTRNPSVTEAADHARAEHAAMIAGLRALADFLEQTPEAPLPAGVSGRRHFSSRDEFAAAARALGDYRKRGYDTGSYVEIARDFGGGVSLHYQAAREEVCEPLRIEGGKVVWSDGLDGTS